LTENEQLAQMTKQIDEDTEQLRIAHAQLAGYRQTVGSQKREIEVLKLSVEQMSDKVRAEQAKYRAFERAVIDMTDKYLDEHPENYDYACMCSECKGAMR